MKAIEIKKLNGYVLRVDFNVDNSGSAFASNYNGIARVVICHWENDQYIENYNEIAGKAKTKSAADKIGRAFIRENNLRDKLAELAK